MSTLLWKEWHEQRWRLGFGCLILGAFAVIGLHARVVADETLMLWTCLLAILLLPVLASTGLMPAERAEGSFEMLLSLPVRPWRVFLAKTLMGIALCAGPLLTAAIVSLAMASGREMDASSIIVLYARSIAATLSLFAWMLALTIRLPNEMRAGLLALGVLIFWLLATGGLIALSDRQQNLSTAAISLWSICPFAFTYGSIATSAPVLLVVAALVVQVLILTALWFWARSRLTDATDATEVRT